MQRSTRHTGFLVAAAVCVLAVAASSALSQRSAQVTRTYDLPNFKFLSIGGHIIKLDTRNGAMYRLRGAPTATQSGNTWTQRVPPVKQAHSGMLDFTQLREGSGDGVFLADVFGESTWLLTWRSNEVGEWRLVPNGP